MLANVTERENATSADSQAPFWLGWLDFTAIPAWIVRELAMRVYTNENLDNCGPGRYVDPNTNSCVYICREGYTWDPVTKACVWAPMAEDRVPKLDKVSKGRNSFSVVSKKLFTTDECPVGYYLDPMKGNSCVPLCAEGYTYDKKLKKCVRN
ncbi:hypothetical protein CYMTET_15324 [Cymbomonas tetramitiformis]|uniref:Uncharacterized protein n=1 Tax=Cymbomonas tetramitiformis TaxID=36881 RepID=A0AAE0L949_9CHLO|nr:hypothetical protein CYMTET_15324 [Cymbomonas tetramitiformis]